MQRKGILSVSGDTDVRDSHRIACVVSHCIACVIHIAACTTAVRDRNQCHGKWKEYKRKIFFSVRECQVNFLRLVECLLLDKHENRPGLNRKNRNLNSVNVLVSNCRDALVTTSLIDANKHRFGRFPMMNFWN